MYAHKIQTYRAVCEVHDTIRETIMCTQKLMGIQLNLLHGTRQQKT